MKINLFSGRSSAEPLNLSNAGCGERLKVVSLRPNSPMLQRLQELGFCESSEVLKVSDNGSALICKLLGSKVAIGRDLGSDIFVERAPEAPLELLSDLAPGQRGRVAKFDLPPESRQRLLEMGLTVGVEFEVIRFAPLGDPLDIKVRGYHLSLRKKEANGIRVARL